jgi:hypothetical protein
MKIELELTEQETAALHELVKRAQYYNFNKVLQGPVNPILDMLVFKIQRSLDGTSKI